jgi:hypothetical protein
MATPLRVVKEYLAKPIDDVIFIPLVQSEVRSYSSQLFVKMIYSVLISHRQL